MKNKIGRNDSCNCGSGKKYKACHGKSKEKSSHLWTITIILVLLIFWFFVFEPIALFTKKNSSPNSIRPTSSKKLNPEPGKAPPGKVWSPEHGHWHDK